MLQLLVTAQQATNTNEATGNAEALLRKRRKLLGPVTQATPKISTSRTKALRLELVPQKALQGELKERDSKLLKILSCQLEYT